jgi:hypothetical protein
MRAVAACQFTLRRFDAWRHIVVAFTAGVVLVLILWFVHRPAVWPLSGVAALVLIALAAIGLCASLLRTPAVSLRWDGRDWHAGPAGSAGQEPATGALSVAVDLGSWMLLRFVPRGTNRWSRAIWLPVQRSAMEEPWHVLRCAVYSPRPARDAAQDAGAAGDL